MTYDNIQDAIAYMNALTNWLVLPAVVFSFRMGWWLQTSGRRLVGNFFLFGSCLMLVTAFVSTVYHLDEVDDVKKIVDNVFAFALLVWTLIAFIILSADQQSYRKTRHLVFFCITAAAGVSIQINNRRGAADDEEDLTIGRIAHLVWHCLATTALLLLVI